MIIKNLFFTIFLICNFNKLYSEEIFKYKKKDLTKEPLEKKESLNNENDNKDDDGGDKNDNNDNNDDTGDDVNNKEIKLQQHRNKLIQQLKKTSLQKLQKLEEEKLKNQPKDVSSKKSQFVKKETNVNNNVNKTIIIISIISFIAYILHRIFKQKRPLSPTEKFGYSPLIEIRDKIFKKQEKNIFTSNNLDDFNPKPIPNEYHSVLFFNQNNELQFRYDPNKKNILFDGQFLKKCFSNETIKDRHSWNNLLENNYEVFLKKMNEMKKKCYEMWEYLEKNLDILIVDDDNNEKNKFYKINTNNELNLFYESQDVFEKYNFVNYNLLNQGSYDLRLVYSFKKNMYQDLNSFISNIAIDNENLILNIETNMIINNINFFFSDHKDRSFFRINSKNNN